MELNIREVDVLTSLVPKTGKAPWFTSRELRRVGFITTTLKRSYSSSSILNLMVIRAIDRWRSEERCYNYATLNKLEWHWGMAPRSESFEIDGVLRRGSHRRSVFLSPRSLQKLTGNSRTSTPTRTPRKSKNTKSNDAPRSLTRVHQKSSTQRVYLQSGFRSSSSPSMFAKQDSPGMRKQQSARKQQITTKKSFRDPSKRTKRRSSKRRRGNSQPERMQPPHTGKADSTNARRQGVGIPITSTRGLSTNSSSSALGRSSSPSARARGGRPSPELLHQLLEIGKHKIKNRHRRSHSVSLGVRAGESANANLNNQERSSSVKTKRKRSALVSVFSHRSSKQTKAKKKENSK